MQPEISDVVAKMVYGGELTPREVLQAYYYMRVQVYVVEDALWQYDAGFLDKESRDTAILNLQRVLLLPAARAAWLMQRSQLPPAVRERIDKLVAGPLADQTWNFAADYEKARAQAMASQTSTRTT